VLGAFFREIDRADELGSGMRKMMLYGKKYGGADPQLIEGDIFRMVISVPEFDLVSKAQTIKDNLSQEGAKMGPRWSQDGVKMESSRSQVEVQLPPRAFCY
jgi:predicted HTH transcriptional regulator